MAEQAAGRRRGHRRRQRRRPATRPYVVAYDVSLDKNREKLARLLERFGVRVGLSVFELTLARAQLAPLVSAIEELLDRATDRAQVYPQCADCAAARRVAGSPLGVAQDRRVVVA